jgi:hypothetical protein
VATSNITYSHGFRRIDQLEIGTSIIETPEISNITYYGSGWMASLGVKMPILLGKDNCKCAAMPPNR